MPRKPCERRYTQADHVRELTSRQREIMTLVSSGLSNQQIAERLGLRLQTVKNQLACIYEKLRARAAGGNTGESSELSRPTRFRSQAVYLASQPRQRDPVSEAAVASLLHGTGNKLRAG